MKALVVFFIVFVAQFGYAQKIVSKIGNPNAYQKGEILVYRIYFESALTGEINAGTAQMVITEEEKEINGKKTLHFIVKGKTIGAINVFFKVKDRFESYVDQETRLPMLFIRDAYESGYTANEFTTFDQKNNIAYFTDNKKNSEKTVKVPENIHDFVSAYYYARILDISNVKPNDFFEMKFMFEDSIYNTKIFYEKDEIASTLLGDFKCKKFKPKVIVGNVFNEDYPLSVWITDDKNRIPLVVESKIIVGFVKLELISYKNLANPLNSLIK